VSLFQPGTQARLWVLPHAVGVDEWDASNPVGPTALTERGPSKYELALELLSYARNRLRCRPAYILFDAWYPSKALLKRVRDYGWYFVCRLKKNRRFNGLPFRAYRRHPYWAETGWLAAGLKVLVVRYGAKYFATNRLTLSAVEVRQLYRIRAQIEEVIRVCIESSRVPRQSQGSGLAWRPGCHRPASAAATDARRSWRPIGGYGEDYTSGSR
jgi:hypothetical protein